MSKSKCCNSPSFVSIGFTGRRKICSSCGKPFIPTDEVKKECNCGCHKIDQYYYCEICRKNHSVTEDRCKHGVDGMDCFECYPTK